MGLSQPLHFWEAVFDCKRTSSPGKGNRTWMWSNDATVQQISTPHKLECLNKNHLSFCFEKHININWSTISKASSMNAITEAPSTWFLATMFCKFPGPKQDAPRPVLPWEAPESAGEGPLLRNGCLLAGVMLGIGSTGYTCGYLMDNKIPYSCI